MTTYRLGGHSFFCHVEFNGVKVMQTDAEEKKKKLYVLRLYMCTQKNDFETVNR
jgi:hypothetical protein